MLQFPKALPLLSTSGRSHNTPSPHSPEQSTAGSGTAACVPQSPHPKALGALPPAEDTLVGTGQAGGGLHAAVALNAIEGVLVAAPTAPQHRLRTGKHTPSN